MFSDTFEQHLKSFAMEMGAADIKRIPVIDIIVEDWVRLKCQYGCPNYGKRLICPPYSPTPEQTRKILEGYSVAFLLRFDVPDDRIGVENEAQDDAVKSAIESLFKMERFAFLNGSRKAFYFGLNHCPECDGCVLEESPSAKCRFPVVMRPSMEACGIDVQKTAEIAGWGDRLRGQDPLRGDKMLSLISLLLVE